MVTVEIGHIKLLLESAQSDARDCYVSAIRLLADPNRLDAQTCIKCNEVLTRTVLCLQCSHVACQREAEAHARSTKHMFGETNPRKMGGAQGRSLLISGERVRHRLKNCINVLFSLSGLHLRPIFGKDTSSKAGGANGREWCVLPSRPMGTIFADTYRQII